jgi:hypothetical protein
MSDEWSGYDGLKKHFPGHKRVKHSKKEYARKGVHVNGIESFWALLKRGIVGTFHRISPKHTDRYVDEFEFRQNNKRRQFASLLDTIEDRLIYQSLISKYKYCSNCTHANSDE